MVDLSKFSASGTETCFHGRHLGAQIYADLNGRNWSIKDYEARGGYQALRKILGKDDANGGGAGMTPGSAPPDGASAGRPAWRAWHCCRFSCW